MIGVFENFFRCHVVHTDAAMLFS